jgi:hypothetical protein
MHPIRTSVAVLATLALALGAISPAVVAQEDAATHPIVGAWVLDATPDDPSDAVDLVVFNPGGTLVSLSAEGPAAGSWEPTGERSVDVTFHGLGLAPDGSFGGLFTIRSSGEVAEDGQTFTATYTVEPPAAMAQMLGTPEGQLGPGEVTAQRINVEPMGEAVGPIPEFPPEPDAPEGSPMAPEASPAA